MLISDNQSYLQDLNQIISNHAKRYISEEMTDVKHLFQHAEFNFDVQKVNGSSDLSEEVYLAKSATILPESGMTLGSDLLRDICSMAFTSIGDMENHSKLIEEFVSVGVHGKQVSPFLVEFKTIRPWINHRQWGDLNTTMKKQLLGLMSRLMSSLCQRVNKYSLDLAKGITSMNELNQVVLAKRYFCTNHFTVKMKLTGRYLDLKGANYTNVEDLTIKRRIDAFTKRTHTQGRYQVEIYYDDKLIADAVRERVFLYLNQDIVINKSAIRRLAITAISKARETLAKEPKVETESNVLELTEEQLFWSLAI
ncbi:hypothetical protein [Photobacterium damselae]|uniref:hypothetical protein n=1 Tax=Photobacterium damselae TaxID=38293 RepID=UPI000D65FB24|nr:hypothetical protein [Photobacterium damselae]AWK84521.1 hypothetical protein BST98_21035 [Photobacterium damselae]MBE8127795.1 hypothetical protein [Photobacterium damselae subsp. piscicida]MCG3823463.1 hypothetical protein [Photobacterium damselae]NVO60195.1 hypothetical protein [Photobacterium damselae subsp. damselae]TLS85791.1 hypothetical protein FD720_14290 [Photobacterium damselae subsp. damselae]